MSPSNKEPEDRQTPRPALSRRFFLKGSSAAVVSAGLAAPVAAQEATPAATPGASPVAAPGASPAATPVAAGQSEESAPAVEFFNPHESEMVVALTARILPGTPDDPGAREAGVVYYIDQQLAGPNEGYTLKTYTQGPFSQVSEGSAQVESTSRTDLYRVIETPSEFESRYGFQSMLGPQEIYRRGLASVDAYAQSLFQTEFLELTEEQQDRIVSDMQEDTATGFEAPSANAFFTKLRNDTIEGMFSDPMYGGNRNMAGWKLIGYPGARGFYTSEDIKNPAFSTEPVSLDEMRMSGHSH